MIANVSRGDEDTARCTHAVLTTIRESSRMESEEHAQVNFEASKKKRRKVFKACTQCRDRKIGCDSKSLECSGCVRRGLHCEYVAIRKMRGRGKKNARNLEDGVNQLESELQRIGVLDDNHENNLINDDHLFTAPRAVWETEPRAEISDNSTNLEASLIRQKYPVFLHPENTVQYLQGLKRAVQDDQKSPEGFSSLVSQYVIQHTLENTYDEITEICPIFDLSTLQRLNIEQQAVSSTHPAGNPARWAILSTWIALAMHLRTVLESKDKFDDVIKSYYRNAVLVLPDLILQPENMETIQALLFMAVYADTIADHRSFIMLVTNATRQIELLAPRLSGMLDSCQIECYQRLLSFSRLQDKKVAEKYSLTLMLNSVPV